MTHGDNIHLFEPTKNPYQRLRQMLESNLSLMLVGRGYQPYGGYASLIARVKLIRRYHRVTLAVKSTHLPGLWNGSGRNRGGAKNYSHDWKFLASSAVPRLNPKSDPRRLAAKARAQSGSRARHVPFAVPVVMFASVPWDTNGTEIYRQRTSALDFLPEIWYLFFQILPIHAMRLAERHKADSLYQ